MDTVVVDKNQMVGELRVGLRVFYPASGTHHTHNFNISSQQLHLLLAGECLVGPIRNASPSSLQAYISAALELSYTELCSICDVCNTIEEMLAFFPLFYFGFCCKTIPFYLDSFIHSLVFSLEGRAWEEPEPSQMTGMAVAHCILGKFLRVVCHCFPPPLDVPTLAARCLRPQRRKTS